MDTSEAPYTLEKFEYRGRSFDIHWYESEKRLDLFGPLPTGPEHGAVTEIGSFEGDTLDDAKKKAIAYLERTMGKQK